MHPETPTGPGNRPGKAERALVAARLNCQHYRPYLRTAVLAMQPVRVPPDDPLATMAVDRWWRLYWNPAFVLDLGVGVLSAVIEHEVLHLLQNHARRQTRPITRPGLRAPGPPLGPPRRLRAAPAPDRVTTAGRRSRGERERDGPGRAGRASALAALPGPPSPRASAS